MFVDPGLASYLQTPRTSEQSGGLMENFVMGELARQLTWSETAAALYHYHDRDGHEVDAVLEDNAGRVRRTTLPGARCQVAGWSRSSLSRPGGLQPL
jgi:predicted AAA+ superfamily ATPase